jgi:integrase
MRAHAHAIKTVVGNIERNAVWLASAYPALEWLVTDKDGKNPIEISFDFVLANGKSLVQMPKLLAAAKEVLFWIRETDSEMTASAIHRYWIVLRNIIHACSLNHIKSLAELSFSSLLQLCQRLSRGVDSMLQASIRIDAFASTFVDRDALPVGCHSERGLDLEEILRRCAIPIELKSTVEVGRAFARARKRFGYPAGRRGEKQAERSEPKVKTAEYLSVYRYVLRSLYDLRHLMTCETILFDPRDAIDTAPEGRESEKTKVVPDTLGFGILEESTRILVEKGAEILEQHAQVSLARHVGSYDHESGTFTRSLVWKLVCACYVLILTFTGRRKSEVLLLVDDCITGNDHRGWWLNIKILKKKNKNRKTWVPIPPLVARAIELLKTLKNLTFASSDSNLLFNAFDPVLNRFIRLRPHLHLAKYTQELGLTSYADANGVVHDWNWESRQFRRFFAMLFFYRYGGSLETISYALRHYNLEITRGYLTKERDLRSMYRMEEYRFRRRVMEDVANDNGEYSGPIFKRLKRYSDGIKRVLREKLFVGTADQVDLMLQFATRERLVIRPKLWVNCCCPATSKGAIKAKCQSINGTPTGPGPDPSNGGESVCGQCPWALRNRANEQHLSRRLAERSAVVKEYQRPANLYENLQIANLIELERFVPRAAA